MKAYELWFKNLEMAVISRIVLANDPDEALKRLPDKYPDYDPEDYFRRVHLIEEVSFENLKLSDLTVADFLRLIGKQF